MLLLSPLFLFPSMTRTLPLLVLPLIWVAAWWRSRELLPVTPLNAAIALLSVMVFVSVFATYDVAFSLPKVAGVVFGVALFFSVARLLLAVGRVALALEVFSLTGAALAVVGLLGTNFVGKVPVLESLVSALPPMIRGVPGQAEGFQPNAVAGALVMFVPLQIALALCARSRISRIVHGVLAVLTGGTVVLTQSRGAWLASACAVLAWMIWQGRATRRFALATIGVVALVVAIGSGWLIPKLESHFGAGIRTDVVARLELWDRAVTAIGDFPLTGMGMNTFRRVVMVLYPTFWTSPDTDVAHAHNHLLQAALDLGLPGLVAYLAIWFGGAVLVFRSLRAGKGAHRVLANGMAVGLLAYFLFGTTDAIALGAKLGVFFWIALALVVAMHESVIEWPGDVPA